MKEGEIEKNMTGQRQQKERKQKTQHEARNEGWEKKERKKVNKKKSLFRAALCLTDKMQ